MGLVIWGHEHEAIYKLEHELDRPVFQPGSTVLTSYIESEASMKQCLLVNALPKGKYELTSILLERSYRPMSCLSFEYSELLAEHGPDFDLFAFLEAELLKAL
jgi:double-strand break repair protein MRE11